MRTSKIAPPKIYLFLFAIIVIATFSVYSSWSGSMTKSYQPAPCSPLWATWELTFHGNASATDKSKQKSILEESIKKFLNSKDKIGSTSVITGMKWCDIDNNRSRLSVYVESRDRYQKIITDSRALKPPSKVKLSTMTQSTAMLYDASTSCSPLWASWDVTFADGTTETQITSLKSAFDDAVVNYVNNTDRLGNSCYVTGMGWIDFDKFHSRVNVCISCYDVNQRAIGDTTAVRPPPGVKPPAGLTATLVGY
jgi:hypothetical protein